MSYSSYDVVRQALERNETSCEELVSSFLSNIDARNGELNAFTYLDAEGALEQARLQDADREAGIYRQLTGLVLGVKDVICVKDRPTTCSSHILDSFVSLYDATAVRRLREAGAIVIGKLNCDEFAMGSSNENSYYGPVHNPRAVDYVPGGSSGGSAAAVAARMCQVALGTDTGGSIRQPAGLTGVVGLKPTYGRVSRFGLVAYASSFDCMGPMANSVIDVARVLEVMAGQDPNDSTSAPVPVDDYVEACSGSVAGMRIGLPVEYLTTGLDDGIRANFESTKNTLLDHGAEVKEISLPHTDYGIATYYILATAEASSNLARYDGVRYGYRTDLDTVRRELEDEKRELVSELAHRRESGDEAGATKAREHLDRIDSELVRLYSKTRAEGFGDEVKRRIILGTYVLSTGYYDAYYAKAQRVRSLIRSDFDRAFEQVDVIMTPVAPTPGFKIGEKIDDPLEMYLSDVYTVTANLAGVPGLVVPTGVHGDPPGLPIGTQFVGRHFGEATLMTVGASVERAMRE